MCADNSEIMRWVTVLPEVGDPLLSKRRAIIELVAQAERLEVVARERAARPIAPRWSWRPRRGGTGLMTRSSGRSNAPR